MFVCYFLFCGHWKQMLEQFFFLYFCETQESKRWWYFAAFWVICWVLVAIWNAFSLSLCAITHSKRWFLCVEAITQRAHSRLEEQWQSHFYTYIYRMYMESLASAKWMRHIQVISDIFLRTFWLFDLSLAHSSFCLLALGQFLSWYQLNRVQLYWQKRWKKKRISKGNILSHRRMNRAIEKKS